MSYTDHSFDNVSVHHKPNLPQSPDMNHALSMVIEQIGYLIWEER